MFHSICQGLHLHRNSRRSDVGSFSLTPLHLLVSDVYSLPEHLPLPPFQKAHHLGAQSSHPGMARNHTQQAPAFFQFSDHSQLHFTDQDVSTVCLFTTHFTCRFSSTRAWSEDSPQGVRSHSSCPGVLPGLMNAPGRRHLHANPTSAMFIPSHLYCLCSIMHACLPAEPSQLA